VCALACANIWIGPGILNTRGGGDSPFLLIRTYELAANLRAGVFPARWMPDAAFGLGYPFFNFYAALPYYLAAGLNALGVNLLTAVKLTQTVGMFAAAGAMVLFARTMLPRWGATLAAAAYVLAPFHLVNVYVRGDSLSEFWAFVWYPLILWTIRQATKDERRKTKDRLRHVVYRLSSVVVLALCLTGLVLTHNVSALIFAPFAAIYALALLVRRARQSNDFVISWLRGAMPLVLAAIWALALSAWFWLPALGEASGVQLGEQTTGYFNYANHFRAANLIQPSFIFDYSVDDQGNAFGMGLIQAVLVALGAGVWLMSNWRARRSYFDIALIAGLFLLSTFMLTPLSQFIWDRTPLLPLAQFPWRFLSVQAVFASVLIGGIGKSGMKNEESRMEKSLSQLSILNSQFSIPFLCILLLSISAVLRLPNERLNILAEDVTPRTIQLYEWYTGNIGTTIRDEYLPATALPPPLTGPDVLGQPRRALVAADGAAPDAMSSELESHSPAGQVWRIRASQPISVALPLLYSPAWRAILASSAGSHEIRLWPHAGSGWATLAVPRGEHRLTLQWSGTSLERIAELISLLAWIALAIALIVAFVLQPASARRRVVIALAAGVGVVLAGVILLRLLPDRTASPPMQTLDYAHRPFPHRDPVIFSDGSAAYELIGAQAEPSQLRAGDSFTLALSWRDDRAPAHITVTQELPMGGEFIKLFRFARSELPANENVSAHVVLSNALPGPTLLKLTAADAEGRLLMPATSSGQPLETEIAGKLTPAITLLGPTVVGTPANAPAEKQADFGNGIALHSIDWFHPSAQEVCFRPQWSRESAKANRADTLRVSMRLRGKDGRLIAQADSQPHGGLAPSWSWQDGVLVNDSQCVDVVSEKQLLEPGEPYTLQIVWYRLANLEQTGEVVLHGKRGPRLEDLNEPHTGVIGD
jgi:hypothetical protein